MEPGSQAAKAMCEEEEGIVAPPCTQEASPAWNPRSYRPMGTCMPANALLLKEGVSDCLFIS